MRTLLQWISDFTSSRLLDVKLRRDLKALKSQALAVALVMACGLAMMIMTRSLMLSLEMTRDAYYERNRFADVFAQLKRAPNSVQAELAAIPGVARVQTGIAVQVTLDIPGLIEGAADGKGLGHQFLRHVERCALLLHLVDGSDGDAEVLAERVRVLNAELARFSPELAVRKQLVVLNKLDTRLELPEIATAVAALLGCEVRCISGVSGQGIKELENHLLSVVPPRV